MSELATSPRRRSTDDPGPLAQDPIVTCDEQTARELTECLLRARPPAVIDPEDVADALGELANVLGGNVKAALPGPSGLGHSQNGSTPPAARPDDQFRVDAQWRGQYLSINVQGATGAPHIDRNEVPQ